MTTKEIVTKQTITVVELGDRFYFEPKALNNQLHLKKGIQVVIAVENDKHVSILHPVTGCVHVSLSTDWLTDSNLNKGAFKHLPNYRW